MRNRYNQPFSRRWVARVDWAIVKSGGPCGMEQFHWKVCKRSRHRGLVWVFLSLILVPNFDDWGRSNNGGGFKLGMTLNEGISISLKGIEITYSYCLHKSSCWSEYGCVRSEIMSESTDYIPESCSSFFTNWALRTSYIRANPSCPPETNQPLLTKDTLKMGVLALPCK